MIIIYLVIQIGEVPSFQFNWLINFKYWFSSSFSAFLRFWSWFSFTIFFIFYIVIIWYIIFILIIIFFKFIIIKINTENILRLLKGSILKRMFPFLFFFFNWSSLIIYNKTIIIFVRIFFSFFIAFYIIIINSFSSWRSTISWSFFFLNYIINCKQYILYYLLNNTYIVGHIKQCVSNCFSIFSRIITSTFIITFFIF